MYPLHLLMGSPSLPRPLMVTLPLTARLRNPVTSPIALAGPALWCPLPGLNDANLQSGKLKQIIPGSQPHKGGERKIPWWDTWGIPTVRTFHKDSELVQCIRQTYFRTHALTFHKEDTYELMEVFKELVRDGRSSEALRSTLFMTSGWGGKNFTLPTMWLGGPPKTSTFSEQWYPSNLPK